jgi:hypothetical protein
MWFDMQNWPELIPLADAAAAFALIGEWDNPDDCATYLAEYMGDTTPVEITDTVYPGSPCGYPEFIGCVTKCVDNNNPLP